MSSSRKDCTSEISMTLSANSPWQVPSLPKVKGFLMPHWMDKVVDLLTTGTADLRQLALLAGGDPRTFYRGINLKDLELTKQGDLWGMQFGEIAEPDIAHTTAMSALQKRGISIITRTISLRG